MSEMDSELWTVETEEGRAYRCVMRVSPGCVEVVITEGATLVARELFPTGTEAYAWAEDARGDLR